MNLIFTNLTFSFRHVFRSRAASGDVDLVPYEKPETAKLQKRPPPGPKYMCNKSVMCVGHLRCMPGTYAYFSDKITDSCTSSMLTYRKYKSAISSGNRGNIGTCGLKTFRPRFSCTLELRHIIDGSCMSCIHE